MILTIDIGNIYTGIGIFQEGNLIKNWSFSTDKNKTMDEYRLFFSNLFLFGELEISQVKGIVISSVVPPLGTTLKNVFQKYYGLEPLLVGPGIKTGINIKMDNPREVGSDRIVNSVAGREKFPGQALIIVDFSTATIFDLISAQGDYLGGVIAPGIKISTEALFRSTAQLPRVELVKPATVIGKNTVASMQAGIIYGFIGQVEGLIRRLKEELKEETYVLATGALMDVIVSEIEMIDRQEPYLSLEGLYYLARLNGLET
ncbi:MAG TPA: type III pantothenate kinase [Halanaerobiaceae bacterium]|jgi:type III pantothenate kinase|nr:type III pantothenate kinase [Bacillota bacterium]HHU91919.1 type III pantothenate kinase [Halanaerobiaceae bacterium]HOA40888.1 type III pantothenate kinase [Halanaerobiales bacterium]HPZ62826.1 type III pantothenate kinase [Halanaerobiales bacterium]